MYVVTKIELNLDGSGHFQGITTETKVRTYTHVVRMLETQKHKDTFKHMNVNQTIEFDISINCRDYYTLIVTKID
jgi:hypothetical protein